MKLEVNDISKKFDENHVLEHVNLNLAEGELVSIVGTSGCGKTTLFNIIAGLLHPETGTVRLDGEEITDKSGRISYMLQKDLLLSHKTVIDNVSLPLVIRGEKKKAARKKAAEYFEQFGLKGCEKQYPSQLSGGMRQRAALLRTFLFSAEVALLDEPFSLLDTITKNKMHEWYLSVMQDIKLSTLFITHDIDEALLLSDRIYILSGSPASIAAEIVIEGRSQKTPEYLLTEDFLSYKRKILGYL